MDIDNGSNKPRFISKKVNPVEKNNAAKNHITKNSKTDEASKEPSGNKKFISDLKNHFAYNRKPSTQNRVTYDLDSLNDI